MSIDYLSLAVNEVQQLAPYLPEAIEELEGETGLQTNENRKLLDALAQILGRGGQA